MSHLAKCSQCGCEPKLMRMAGVFYECCNTMGSFPPAPDEKTARSHWNQMQDAWERSKPGAAS